MSDLYERIQRDQIISELEEINACNREPMTDNEVIWEGLIWIVLGIITHFVSGVGWILSMLFWMFILPFELIKWLW